MKKSKLVLLFLIPFFLFLAACGDLAVELNKDGSGKVEMAIPSSGMITAGMIEEELRGQFGENEGISKVSIKDKDGVVEVKFQFDDTTTLDSDFFQIPVGDYVLTNDTRLEELILDGELVEFTEDSSAIFIRIPKGLNDFDTTEVTVPGEIVAHTDSVTVIEKDTVDINASGSAYIVYEPKAGSSFLIFAAIGIIIIIGGVVFFNRKKNNTKVVTPDEKEVEVNA